MKSLQNIANKNTSCSTDVALTGSLGCQIEFGTPTHAIAMLKGTIIPKTTVFDKTYIDLQTQLGKFIPILSADSFEDTSSEDSMNTNSRGVERLSVLGLPKWQLTFQQGHEFYRQVSKLTSFKNFDFIFADEAGNWRIAVNAEGDYCGFQAGQVLAMMTKVKVQGGDPESKTIAVQMTNRNQWDREYVIISRSEIDFSAEDLGTINPVHIHIDPVVAADTKVKFKVLLASDRSTAIAGLKIASFVMHVNGAPVVPTSINEVPGGYEAAIVSLDAGDKIVLKTYDTTAKSSTVLLEGMLYSGHSDEIVVG